MTGILGRKVCEQNRDGGRRVKPYVFALPRLIFSFFFLNFFHPPAPSLFFMVYAIMTPVETRLGWWSVPKDGLAT